MFSSYLEIIDDCDNFPFIDLSSTPSNEPPSPHIYYALILPGNDATAHGYIHPSVVEAMPWTEDFRVSEPGQRPRRVTLLDSSAGADTAAACNAAFLRQVQAAREKDVFRALSAKRIDEHFRVMGVHYPPLRKVTTTATSAASPPPSREDAAGRVQLPRSATALFGIANRGAHMNVYTRDAVTGEIRMWIPRRSAHLRTWPGKLDNSVAGGVRAEESPLECITHEADEEASLDPEFVRREVRPCGAVTYVSVSGEGSGGEHGLICPDVLYTYDLEVPATTVLAPQDDEVEAFHLWDMARVKAALFAGEFKTNCNIVLIDFFVRHGVITEDNIATGPGGDDYLEILRRLRRKLPVPTSPSFAAATETGAGGGIAV
ncbi:NUDIX hydrolase domain-like protein [Microdochium bolleyi]|uniref:NUDIX hydrolase domain-like protein n=1 Tax=Microdochium bolleyi TaxID=196109 RepID=A0A136J5L6_9PEZI|nr:NUDIX hydrolase domain-like protein [Microdochium bolleyi]